MRNSLLWLWLGGGLGTLGRYLLSTHLHHWFGAHFPFGTLGVNLLGCLLIGVLAEVCTKTSVHPDIRLCLITGVLGGFTTFSAFGLDAIDLLKQGAMASALAYIGSSVLLGIIAVWCGEWLVKLVACWGGPS